MTENFSTYFSRRDHINSKDIVVVNGTYCRLWKKVLFDIIITGFHPKRTWGKHLSTIWQKISTHFSRCDHINFKDIVVVNGTYCCLWRKVLFDIIITSFHHKRTCSQHINRTNWYSAEKKKLFLSDSKLSNRHKYLFFLENTCFIGLGILAYYR